MRVIATAMTALALITSSAGWGKDRAPSPPPQAYQKLAACKAVASPEARLACYDHELVEFDKATSAGEIVMTDKATLQATKRGLFGFSLPSLNLFGGGDGADGFSEIESTIESARSLGYDGWRVTLPDGAIWEQSDKQRLVMDPKPGQKVRIRRSALGSYMVNIDGQNAIRMRRIR